MQRMSLSKIAIMTAKELNLREGIPDEAEMSASISSLYRLKLKWLPLHLVRKKHDTLT